jgi:GT2 family glycosyltransferase
MFFSAAITETIPLLDDRFFLTFEESDLCFRAKKQGFRSYCVGDAKVYHKISASFGGSSSPLITYFLTRNSLLWGERHLSLKEYAGLVIVTLRRMIWATPLEARSRYRIIRLIEVLKLHYRGECDSVASHAAFLGVRDYFLRRFGNCSSAVTLALKAGSEKG